MEDKEKTVSITLTKEEFSHLYNDLISYIWGLEDRGCDKDNSYGYFSRVRLKKKMQLLEEAYFSGNDQVCGG